MCGIVGIFGHPEASKLTYLGLYALQHRGQESAGIVSSDGERLHAFRQMGHVSEIFKQEALDGLPGDSAVGHVRYSTYGSSELKNAQPFVVEYGGGGLAIAHNGNLVNAAAVRSDLERRGSIFQSSMDTEVIVHLMASSGQNGLVDRVVTALRQVRGAWSLLFLTEHRLIAARDPLGFRPLVLGRLRSPKGGEATVVASETCALDLIEAEFVREIEPGEMVVVSHEGLQSFHPFGDQPPAHCIFEFVYFSRPDSVIFGRPVYTVRRELGRQLARECPAQADVVIPVPDSGGPAALGYSEESRIPFEMGLIRNHYVGRTFIEPEQGIRHFGVKVKLNPVRPVLQGKRVVVIDDSIVRGTTSRKIVKMVRDAGAREVHMRISSPPILSPCYYGIDTPTKEELIGSQKSIEEIRAYLLADSLGYLSLEGMIRATGAEGRQFCTACFTGTYPVPFAWPAQQHPLPLFDR